MVPHLDLILERLPLASATVTDTHCLDGSLYSYSFIHFGKIHILQEDIVTAGIVLGFSMFFTVLAGMTVRRLKYELFYIIHLGLFVVMVVTLGLHRPSFDKDKTLIVTVLVASLWCCDRLIRLARLMYNGINNKATIYPLPNGGTRIVLKKPMARARPGSEYHPGKILAARTNRYIPQSTVMSGCRKSVPLKHTPSP